jgi:hypothetical protein
MRFMKLKGKACGEGYGHGISQTVNSDTLALQSRAHFGRGHTMLIRYTFHTMNVAPFTSRAGEHQASITR